MERRIRKKTRKQAKKQKQKGGFYPSVYSGVSTAGLLTVAAARQGYRLWNNRKTKKQRKTRMRK